MLYMWILGGGTILAIILFVFHFRNVLSAHREKPAAESLMQIEIEKHRAVAGVSKIGTKTDTSRTATPVARPIVTPVAIPDSTSDSTPVPTPVSFQAPAEGPAPAPNPSLSLTVQNSSFNPDHLDE